MEIDELDQTDNEAPEVTGGYLLALGRKNDPEGTGQIYRHSVTEGGEVFFGETPEFYTNYSDDETGTEAQFAYISDYLQKTEDAVLSDNFTDKDGVPSGAPVLFMKYLQHLCYYFLMQCNFYHLDLDYYK
ncbi:MAG: hypothetical protein IJM87_01255 [Ruminococcus sp.]|nr:hypothetical protein [Ruminococcus sp.]